MLEYVAIVKHFDQFIADFLWNSVTLVTDDWYFCAISRWMQRTIWCCEAV